MSVVRLQFEYWLSLPYTLPLGLPSSSESLLRNQALGVEKGTVHELKPSRFTKFTSSIRVWYSVWTPTIPSISQPLCLAYTHFIPQVYLGLPSDPDQELVLDSLCGLRLAACTPSTQPNLQTCRVDQYPCSSLHKYMDMGVEGNPLFILGSVLWADWWLYTFECRKKRNQTYSFFQFRQLFTSTLSHFSASEI
jgi:hypothetical protein